MKDPVFDKPLSDLRRRMQEDMAVRRFGEKTQHDYIRHVENFVKFLGRSPETATGEDLQTLSGASGRARRSAAEHEQLDGGLALLLHLHARSRQPRPAADPRGLSA